jgi:hypothetical protein
MTKDDRNRGTLFKNDRRTTDRDRDFSGSINVDGKDYWLSGWRKKSKAGQPYLSLSVKVKEPAATRLATEGLHHECHERL